MGGRGGYFGQRDRKKERGAFARRRIDPNPAAVTGDDLLTGRETDTASRAILTMKPLEWFED